MRENFSILENLINLKKQKELTKNKCDCRKYNKAFDNAMSRFGYIVDRHSFKYRNFPNYQDIKQEGNIGLAFAIEKFNPERSKNFFKLANWYIRTRIKRSANKHCVVNIPLTYEDKIIINRIQDLGLIMENRETPLDHFEKQDLLFRLNKAIDSLKEPYKTAICLYHGISIGNDKPKKLTIKRISKILQMEEENVEEIINEGYKILKEENLLNK